MLKWRRLSENFLKALNRVNSTLTNRALSDSLVFNPSPYGLAQFTSLFLSNERCASRILRGRSEN
jgi:hypothetical protein